VDCWLDKNGKRIRTGDTLRNEYNEPPNLPVLSNETGQLFLGDMETPFCTRYCFDEFWEIESEEEMSDNKDNALDFNVGDDKSYLVARNNELMRIAEELEYKLEYAIRKREEILKPIRDEYRQKIEGKPVSIQNMILNNASTWRAIKKSLEIANKAGGG